MKRTKHQKVTRNIKKPKKNKKTPRCNPSRERPIFPAFPHDSNHAKLCISIPKRTTTEKREKKKKKKRNSKRQFPCIHNKSSYSEAQIGQPHRNFPPGYYKITFPRTHHFVLCSSFINSSIQAPDLHPREKANPPQRSWPVEALPLLA